MNRILLLGGGGFVGRNLILHLHDKFVFGVIGRTIDKVFMDSLNVWHESIDVNSTSSLKSKILDFSPDIVVNLISKVNTDRFIDNIDDFMCEQISIVINVFNATKEVPSIKLFVQIGSLEEYGNINFPFKESDSEFPNSPYAISKLFATKYYLMMHKLIGFPVVVWRLTSLYGHFQDNNKFIPYIVSKLSNDLELFVSHGNQKRDFLSVRQLSFYFEFLIDYSIKNKGRIINVGSGYANSLKMIIEKLREELSSKSIVNYGLVESIDDEPKVFIGDYSILKSILESQQEDFLIKEIKELFL